MPSEEECVVGGEPGPFGAAGSEGDPAGVAVELFLDGHGANYLHDFILLVLSFLGWVA